MIRRYACTVLTLTTLSFLTGCAAKPRVSATAPVPTPGQTERLRSSYRSAFPKARVGIVTAVLGTDAYALVGEIDSAGLRNGDVFSFIDANEAVIASGVVRKVDPGSVTVRYDAGVRRPQVGDVAVKF